MHARRAGWPTIDFRQLDLRGAQMRSWLIEGEVGRPFDLSGCRFDGADLHDGAFRHVRLDRASFADSRLARSNFLRCAIGGANFQRAEIIAAIFRNSTLETARGRMRTATGRNG
ncbi:MAG TPA: pentapeptide repeat-containing protein [Accumulibacter sp.]|nr:pentapeptide repeat-containing protein [Accumulibacter sp.]